MWQRPHITCVPALDNSSALSVASLLLEWTAQDFVACAHVGQAGVFLCWDLHGGLAEDTTEQ